VATSCEPAATSCEPLVASCEGSSNLRCSIVGRERLEGETGVGRLRNSFRECQSAGAGRSRHQCHRGGAIFRSLLLGRRCGPRPHSATGCVSTIPASHARVSTMSVPAFGRVACSTSRPSCGRCSPTCDCSI
jgi:hypothetical protein